MAKRSELSLPKRRGSRGSQKSASESPAPTKKGRQLRKPLVVPKRESIVRFLPTAVAPVRSRRSQMLFSTNTLPPPPNQSSLLLYDRFRREKAAELDALLRDRRPLYAALQPNPPKFDQAVPSLHGPLPQKTTEPSVPPTEKTTKSLVPRPSTSKRPHEEVPATSNKRSRPSSDLHPITSIHSPQDFHPLLSDNSRRLQLVEAQGVSKRPAPAAPAAPAPSQPQSSNTTETELPLPLTQAVTSPPSSAHQPLDHQEQISPPTRASSPLTPISVSSDGLNDHLNTNEGSVSDDDFVSLPDAVEDQPAAGAASVEEPSVPRFEQIDPPSPRQTVIKFLGQQSVPLRLNGRQWLSEPRPLEWSPTLDREGLEAGDYLDHLRPSLDPILTSLIPALGSVPAPPEVLPPGSPLGTARPLPLFQRRYVANLVRQCPYIPSGVRSALAAFVEQDQWRPPNDRSILLAKPVWVVPLQVPLPVAVTDQTTDATQAQFERSTLVLVAEPRLPQSVLLTMPNEMMGVLMRTGTYSPHVDTLGNYLLDSHHTATAASAIASSHAGGGIGASVCPAAPINIELDPTLGQPRSNEDFQSDQQALLFANNLTRRIQVPLPRSVLGSSSTRSNGDERNTLLSHRLCTGPFMWPGEKERWWTRVVEAQKSSVTLAIQSSNLEAANLRMKRHKVAQQTNEEQIEASNVSLQLRRMRRNLTQLRSDVEKVQAETASARRSAVKEQAQYNSQLEQMQAQQAAARAKARAKSDQLRRMLAEMQAQSALTQQRQLLVQTLDQQAATSAQETARDEDEEMVDELAGLAEEAMAYA